MKKYSGVPEWVIFTAVGLSIGISIWALVMANSEPFSFFRYNFDYTKLVEFSGLMFSVIGVIFTVYFVIIGINANKIKEEINSIDESVTDKKAQIENELKRIESENLYNMYGHLLDMAKYITIKKDRARKINSLTLSRARLATQSRLLSKDKRLQRMPALDMLGDKVDIDDLNNIIHDPTEDEKIIESAKMRKEAIERRLGII